MGGTLVKRGYRYRFYPTEKQVDELRRTMGCVRFVYNKVLEARATAWEQHGRHLDYNDTSAMLTEWKTANEFSFLREVSSVPLQQTLRHLQKAFTAFWAKRASYPRFKSRKRGRGAAEYTRSAFRWRSGQLWLAKMDEPLAIVWSRPLPPEAEPSTVTVTQDAAGRWFCSILVETRIEHFCPVNGEVGIDLGLTALATLSTGEAIGNPRHELRERNRYVRAQKVLARKERGSKNAEKARRRLARIHARVADRRKDFLHKLTSRIVRENQTIVIEDLAVRNLVKNRSLSRAISDASWSELRTMLTYKASWYGRTLIVVERWYPSSKTCSECEYRLDKLPMNARRWVCPGCGTSHDRDVNASRNLLAAGRAVTACGDGVRPTRQTLVRRPSQTSFGGRKQELASASSTGISGRAAGEGVKVRL